MSAILPRLADGVTLEEIQGPEGKPSFTLVSADRSQSLPLKGLQYRLVQLLEETETFEQFLEQAQGEGIRISLPTAEKFVEGLRRKNFVQERTVQDLARLRLGAAPRRNPPAASSPEAAAGQEQAHGVDMDDGELGLDELEPTPLPRPIVTTGPATGAQPGRWLPPRHPQLRTDLVIERDSTSQAPLYRLRVPGSQSACQLYEVELCVAGLMDGSHDLQAIVQEAGLSGLPMTEAQLGKFIRELVAYGLLANAEPLPPPRPIKASELSFTEPPIPLPSPGTEAAPPAEASGEAPPPEAPSEPSSPVAEAASPEEAPSSEQGASLDLGTTVPSPTPRLLLQAGLLLYKSGNHPAAAKTFRDLLALDPSHVEARTLLEIVERPPSHLTARRHSTGERPALAPPSPAAGEPPPTGENAPVPRPEPTAARVSERTKAAPVPSRARRPLPRWPWALGAGLLLLLGVAGLGLQRPLVLQVPAELAGIQDTPVPAPRSGRLAELSVKEGQPVRRGERLARIEDTALELERQKAATEVSQLEALQDPRASARVLRQARKAVQDHTSSLASLQLKLKRAQQRRAHREAATLEAARERVQLELAQALARLDQLTADSSPGAIAHRAAELERRRQELARLEAQVQGLEIHAPMDGVVRTARHEAVGTQVREGEVLVELVESTRLVVTLRVPRRLATDVGRGAPLTWGHEKPLRGKVLEVKPAPSETLLEVELESAPQALRPREEGTLVLDTGLRPLAVVGWHTLAGGLAP